MDMAISIQSFIKDYLKIIPSLKVWPKRIQAWKEEMVLISAEQYESMKQQLIVQDRDKEVKNAKKEGKTYKSMHDFITECKSSSC